MRAFLVAMLLAGGASAGSMMRLDGVGGGAPSDAAYLTNGAVSGLSAEVNIQTTDVQFGGDVYIYGSNQLNSANVTHIDTGIITSQSGYGSADDLVLPMLSMTFDPGVGATAVGGGIGIDFVIDGVTTSSINVVATSPGGSGTRMDFVLVSSSTPTIRAVLDAAGNLQIDGDLTVDGTGASTFAGAIIATQGAGDLFTINRTLTDETAEDGMYLNCTGQHSLGGTQAQRCMVLVNTATDAGITAMLVMDNADNAGAGNAIAITDSGGGGWTSMMAWPSGTRLLDTADGTITFDRSSSGTVTLTATDDNADAAITVKPGGAADMELGSTTTSQISLTTDSAGLADVYVTGVVQIGLNPASTNTVVDMLTLERTTTGTAANGIGAGIAIQLENAAGTNAERAAIDVVLDDATNASEDASVALNVASGGVLREVLRAQGDYTLGDFISTLAGTIEIDWRDAANDAAAVPLVVKHTLSSGAGAAGMGAFMTFALPDASASAGAYETAGTVGFSWSDATNGSEDSTFDVTVRKAGAFTAQMSVSSVGQVKANTTTGSWTAFAAAAVTADTNMMGPFRASYSGGRFGNISCSWNVAGSGGTTAPVLQVYNVTDIMSLCTCTLSTACNGAALVPGFCSCNTAFAADKTYAIRFDTIGDCAVGPDTPVCTAEVGFAAP